MKPLWTALVIAVIALFGSIATLVAEASDLSGVAAQAAAGQSAGKKIKYKSKDVDFDAMSIQGQLKKPELSVVTGNNRKRSLGLMRVRKDFLDKMAVDNGEAIQ